MEIKCIVVEDEQNALRLLEKYIGDSPFLKLENKCKNAFEAMEVLHKSDIQLMFLDINMPKMSGLNLLKILKNPPLVIITSAYREYALESFELDVIDYLKKPYSFDRFLVAVNKAIARLTIRESKSYLIPETKREQIEKSFLFVKEDKTTYKVDFKDILYIQAVSDYIKIFTPEKVYLTYHSLKKIQNILPCNMFPRVHKSYCISISKINKIIGNYIVINQAEIPIGQTYRKDFMDLIESFNKA